MLGASEPPEGVHLRGCLVFLPQTCSLKHRPLMSLGAVRDMRLVGTEVTVGHSTSGSVRE